MRRIGWMAFVLIVATLATSAAAHAQKRVALVIGNSAYPYPAVLANPRNDATDMAAALKKHGIEVIEGYDLDKAAFDRKVRDFASALKGADAGIFFYAGHGLQVSGVNYLVPIDAKAEGAEMLEFEMVRASVVQGVMEQLTNTNILFLDACRNNPLARNLARAMGTRSTLIGRGLRGIESGLGTLISFSTAPDTVASDGAGRNSPYTGALVKHIAASTEDLAGILVAVRNDVIQATRKEQVPWEHSALIGRFYFSAPTQETALPSLPTGSRPTAFSGETAGGRFTRAHAQRVRALVEKHGLSLPVFQIEVPGADVPAHLRRFIGVWIFSKDSERAMMIVATRVSKDGKLDYWTWGPTGPANTYDYPAGLFQIAGTITGDTLRYTNPKGNSNFQFIPTSSNRLKYTYSSTRGETAALVFEPVWTLVEAEQSAKK
jgi:hypothetical protein